MEFGISMLAILMSIISNQFYRKKIEHTERRKEREEIESFRKEVLNKLNELEKKQRQYFDLIQQKDMKSKNIDEN